MNVTSPITGKQYDPAKCAYLSNNKQAYSYLRNDAHLLDILYFNTKSDSLVFVFEKNKKLKELYELWNQHELS